MKSTKQAKIYKEEKNKETNKRKKKKIINYKRGENKE